MNREIKFRVRDKSTGRIIGYECLFPSDIENTDFKWACSVNGRDWMPGLIYENKILLREQFTGLKDQKKEEIYEVDIVEEKNESGVFRYIVFFDKYTCQFQVRPAVKMTKVQEKNGNFFHGLGTLFTEFTVIGDIYRNPELIK